MHRREVLRGLGATVGVGVFAGCSALGGGPDGGSNGGGTGGPFAATIQGPYSYRVNDDWGFFWGRVTLRDVPDDWPPENYYLAWVGTEADGPTEPMAAMEGNQPTTNYRYEKEDFVGDGSLTVDGSLGEMDEYEPGTTFTFLAQAPDAEKYHTVGKLTYRGDATEKTPSEVP